jgi:hypothetical protein
MLQDIFEVTLFAVLSYILCWFALAGVYNIPF